MMHLGFMAAALALGMTFAAAFIAFMAPFMAEKVGRRDPKVRVRRLEPKVLRDFGLSVCLSLRRCMRPRQNAKTFPF